MFVENLDKIDESLRDQFVEHEKDGVKGFIDKDTKAALDTLFHVKDEKKGYLEKLKTVGQELDEYKSSESERIQKAKEEALKKAKEENNIDEILRIEREKLDDEKRRIDETQNQFNERMKTIADKQKSTIASALASELATDKGKLAFERLIAPLIEVDPMTGDETYLNQDGSASSLNRKQFADEIKKDPLFASLVKADIHTQGGGHMNGGSGGADITKKPSEMTSAERLEFKQRDPDGFRQAFNL